MASRCSAIPSRTPVPRTGWPANGSSLVGVKIRMRASPPSRAGSRNTVSERFSSRARRCICRVGDPAGVREHRQLIPLQGAVGEDVHQHITAGPSTLEREPSRLEGVKAGEAIDLLGHAHQSRLVPNARRCDRRRPKMSEVVLKRVEDGVAVLTLNRPDRLNAWTREMEHATSSCSSSAPAHRQVRVIVVTGDGPGVLRGGRYERPADPRRGRRSTPARRRGSGARRRFRCRFRSRSSPRSTARAQGSDSCRR